MSCRPHVLQRLRARLNRNLTRSNLGQIEFPARVVDVNSDQIAVAVVVEYDALGNLAAFDARPRREINVQRIRVGIVADFHGIHQDIFSAIPCPAVGGGSGLPSLWYNSIVSS